jgi:hypothetical protein
VLKFDTCLLDEDVNGKEGYGYQLFVNMKEEHS